MVEVDHQQGTVLAAPPAGRTRFFQAVEQQTTVGHGRQRIVESQVMNFRFGDFQVADVGERADKMSTSPTIAHTADGQPLREDFAILAAVPDFSANGRFRSAPATYRRRRPHPASRT
jgi:hypothetical protein